MSFIARLPKIIQAALSEKEMATTISKMPYHTLILINTNLEDKSFTEEAKKVYKSLVDSNLLDTCIEILNKDGLYGWLCSNAAANEIIAELIPPIEYSSNEIEDISIKEPFSSIRVNLPSVQNESEVRLLLNTKWETIRPFIKEEKPEEEKKPEEEPEEQKEEPKEKEEQKDTEQNSEEQPEEFDDDDDDLDLDLDLRGARGVNVGKLYQLKTPCIFVLDPRKKATEYKQFIGPDPKDARTPKASKILPKTILFHSSKIIKSSEGLPLLIYFMSVDDANKLRAEINAPTAPQISYFLGEFDKTLFQKDEPFTDLKIGNNTIDTKLADELNQMWADVTARSGNPISALQAAVDIPFDYFRLLNKEDNKISYYLGNRPSGAGVSGLIYVLASEQEVQEFLTYVNKIKLPSLFYERLSELPDIDAEFKTIDPMQATVRNVLMLTAKTKFEPDAPVEITDDNKFLITDKDTEEIQKEVEDLKKRIKDPNKLETEIKKVQAWTQLKFLHAYARDVLGNTTVTGTFVKQGVILGSRIAQFNAKMTLCFLWSSYKSKTINPKDVLKALPFVKTVDTRYL